MRAFHPASARMIARGCDATSWSSVPRIAGERSAFREFLTRNGQSHTMPSILDRDAGVQELLRSSSRHRTPTSPSLITCSEVVAPPIRPNQQLARRNPPGFNDAVDQTQVRDLLIVGAGPADWPLAVYLGASEAIGCLARWSPSRLEARPARAPKSKNYLGFSHGDHRSGSWLTAPRARHRSSGPSLIDRERRVGPLGMRPRPVPRSNIGAGKPLPARAVITATGRPSIGGSRLRTYRSFRRRRGDYAAHVHGSAAKKAYFYFFGLAPVD